MSLERSAIPGLFLLVLVCCGGVSLPVSAADSPTAISPATLTDDQVSTPAELVGPELLQSVRVHPNYPQSAAEKGQEGWVVLQFMVDTSGEPFAISVSDSSGIQGFEHESIRAAEKLRFTPAYFNGEPVEGSYEYKFTFYLEGAGQGASDAFRNAYDSFQQALAAGDVEKTEAAYRTLSGSAVNNFYENAWLGVVQSQYGRLIGDQAEELDGLQRATRNLDKPELLPPETVIALLGQRFLVEVRQNMLLEALETFAKLSEIPSAEQAVAMLQPTVDQITTFIASGTGFAMEGTIGDTNTWSRALIHQRIKLEQVEGQVSAVRFYCDTGYREYEYIANHVFELPTALHGCSVMISGAQGATFSLVQY